MTIEVKFILTSAQPKTIVLGVYKDNMEFGIIGTSIWQQNLKLLERLTVDRDSRTEALCQLKDYLSLDELIYLSTCNRVEFVYISSGRYSGSKLLHRLIDFFFRDQQGFGFFPNDFYHYTGREAVAHLFRTTASLESLVVGETQIAGQYKEAYMEALATGLAGNALKDISEEALLVAKKVKRETSVGSGSVSMASLAADELAKVCGEESTIALIGAGAMTVKLARYILDHKLGSLLFVNRTREKAESLAEQFGGRAVSLDDFIAEPPRINAIVSATAAPGALFDARFLDALPPSDAPVICIDLAIPKDFGACFNDSPKVKLIDIAYLRSACTVNLRQKFIETGKANEIVRAAVNDYMSDRIEVSLKPIFTDSFQESMQLAKRALDDLFAKKVTAISDEDKDAIYRLVTKLIANSAYQPAKVLSDKLANLSGDIDLTELRRRKTAI